MSLHALALCGKVEREGRRDDARPLQSEAVTVRISRLRLGRDDEPEATCHGQRLPLCRVTSVDEAPPKAEMVYADAPAVEVVVKTATARPLRGFGDGPA